MRKSESIYSRKEEIHLNRDSSNSEFIHKSITPFIESELKRNDENYFARIFV